MLTTTDSNNQRSKQQFVPFSQERDHLGRLLSSRTPHSSAQGRQSRPKEETGSRQREKRSENEEKAE